MKEGIARERFGLGRRELKFTRIFGAVEGTHRGMGVASGVSGGRKGVERPVVVKR
jgi:hypothetical protein